MTEERWQVVKAIFHDAVESDPSVRAELLRERCGGDEELRSEVESLLTSDGNAGSLIDHPLFESPPEAAAEPKVRVLKDRYEVERELGRGGMSVVYLARDRQLLAKRVVVKVLLEETSQDPWIRQKFQQEMEALTRIDHPGVVGVLDSGFTPEGKQLLVMQYIEGESLRSVIGPGGMDRQRAAGIIRQIGQALGAAHDKGVLHRDLKPENIMLQRLGGEDHVKLIDFGIAGIQNSQFTGEKSKVAGTLHYMAPEQFTGQASAASDTYALAVVAYELLTGTRPAPEEGSRGELPAAVEASIRKALAFRPELRQGSVREFSEELYDALRGSEPVRAAETAKIPVGASRQGTWVAAAGIIVLLAVGGLVWHQMGGVRPAAGPAGIAAPERSLRYYVTVQKWRDGQPYQQPFRLSGERIFEADYRIRLSMSSSQSGYLYVLNEGPQSTADKPDLNTLFPSPAIEGGSARVDPGREVDIPSAGHWIRFDGQKGTEKLWLVWSGASVAELEALKKYVNSQDKGAVADAAQAGAVLALLHKYAANVGSEADETGKMTILKGRSDVIARLVPLEHD